MLDLPDQPTTLLFALAAVVFVPPAVAVAAAWWSVKFRNGWARLQATKVQIGTAVRQAVLRWLHGADR